MLTNQVYDTERNGYRMQGLCQSKWKTRVCLGLLARLLKGVRLNVRLLLSEILSSGLKGNAIGSCLLFLTFQESAQDKVHICKEYFLILCLRKKDTRGAEIMCQRQTLPPQCMG